MVTEALVENFLRLQEDMRGYLQKCRSPWRCRVIEPIKTKNRGCRVIISGRDVGRKIRKPLENVIEAPGILSTVVIVGERGRGRG